MTDTGDDPARGPRELTGLSRPDPPEAAAGPEAVAEAIGFTARRTGPRRGLKLLRSINQPHGTDCPSCAWPEPEDPSVAEFCENGARAIADEADRSRVDADFFARHSVAELASMSDHWLNDQGRLCEPVHLSAGASHYRPVSWDEAFSLVGGRLRATTPERAVFYTSGRTSNEAAFMWQLFARAYGTNNLPDCSNMCHESSGVALTESIGIGKGTVRLEDFDNAEVIIVAGQNPGSNHPRMLTALERAVDRGARIITVNPLREVGTVAVRNPQHLMHPRQLARVLGQGTRLASLHLPVRVNGDVACFVGLLKGLLELEDAGEAGLDRGFIASRTAGFDDLEAATRALGWTEICDASGLEREAFDEAVAILAPARRVIACWAMGLTQHANAVGNIQTLTNLVLAKGSIGKPGAGLCPVRGHSNVQGDRTVGITEKPAERFLDRLDERFGIRCPRTPGHDTVSAIRAMLDGDVDVFVAMGGNFLAASPDTDRTAQGLRSVGLTAHVSTKLNRSHLVTGEEALILPCLGRSERDVQGGVPQTVSTENSMGVITSSRGVLDPVSSQLRSEPAIVAGIAEATLGGSPIEWSEMVADYSAVRDAIEATVDGFDRYSDRLESEGRFELPNGPRDGEIPTPTGLAHFLVHDLPVRRLADDELLLMTIRSHDQFNTTIYGLDDRYRGIAGERRVLFANPEDMAERGIYPDQHVRIRSHFDDGAREVRGYVVVPYDIPRGCVGAYFPEANALVPLDHVAERSHTPASKSVVVTVESDS